MRILHTEWSDGFGGQERRILAEMTGMRARGHDIWLATRAEAQLHTAAEAAGIPTLHLPLRGAADLASAARLARQLRRLRIDVVNTHSGIDSWVGGIAARWARSPVLLRTRHLNNPLRRGWTNFVHYLPDRIIACGEAVRTRLVDECGFPAAQVVSIPTGIDFARFRPARPRHSVRAALGLDDTDELLLMVGVLRGVKRHLLALEAIHRLGERRPRLQLVLAGDGPMREEIAARAETLGLTGRVHFLGHRDDVPDLMGAADGLLLSSRSEGVPQAVTQELGMGLPVVATDVGGVPELIRQEDTGLLVPTEDADAMAAALDRVFTDPGWAKTLGERGRAHVHAHFSLDAMLDTTERLCDDLLQRPERTTR